MPGEKTYYVVLDANILVRDFWMEGASFSYLLTHQFLGHRPVVPEVAFLEARNQLRERAETLLANRSDVGEGSVGNTLRLSRLFNYKGRPNQPKWDVDNLLRRWEKHVKDVLDRHGGQLCPSPQIGVAELTQRSIDRRRPFNRGDRGFRDTLIWLSTLSLATHEARVSFVSNNTADFFDSDGREAHPDIVAEVEDRLSGEWKMLFHRSLDEFIMHFDSDRSASAEALQRGLISNSLSGFDLWNWLEENLPTLIDRDLDMVNWAGVPPSAEAPYLRNVEEIVALDLPIVRHLANDRYRLYCDLSFIGYFDCDIGYNTAESVVHPNQILRKDEEDPFWTEVLLRAAGTILVALDFDASRKQVVGWLAEPLEHWRSYGEAIDRLEKIRVEVEQLDGGWDGGPPPQ